MGLLFAILIYIISSSDTAKHFLPQDIHESYSIYKLANKIGDESCSISDSSLSIIYKINFSFNDRGIKRQLNTQFKMDKDGSPEYFISSGFTSRWVKENRALYWTKPARSHSFPTSKYAPATMQKLLISYWHLNGEPDKIFSLSDSLPVQITHEGYDTLSVKDANIVLRRLKIKSPAWGNEFAWTNEPGNLIFLSTNDTEGDKAEIVNDHYKDIFSDMLQLSTKYSIEAVQKEFPIQESIEDLAVVGATMINVVGRDVLTENSLVTIHNGKIVYAGGMDFSKIPSRAIKINALGKYIIPGLWDMHAHLMQPEWLKKYIMQGITTVRDCGSEFNYINALETAVKQNKLNGPQIIKAGLIDGKSNNSLGAIQADTKGEAIQLVRQYYENGFSQIKVYSSVSLPVLKVICEEAHKLGMTVTGHVPTGYTTTTAINAGMDMISHVHFFNNSLKINDDSLDSLDKKTNNFVQLLADKHIVLDPTLSVYQNSDSFFVKSLYRYRKITNGLRKIKVPIVAGTDMSGNISDELNQYVISGFTTMEAIKSATIVPAEVMRLDKENGSIEFGKNADIIILNSNPVENISNLKDINTVIHRNHLYAIK